jgi:hypothetical protein
VRGLGALVRREDVGGDGFLVRRVCVLAARVGVVPGFGVGGLDEFNLGGGVRVTR